MRFIAILTVSMLLMSCENNAQNVKELKTHKDSVSYAIGYSIGQNFKMQSVDVDPVILAAAINHVTKDDKSALMTEEVAQQVMMAYQTELMAKQEEERKAKGAKNKTEGEKFLAANKSKEGVITTASGLQYQVIKMGDGPKPTTADRVKCHYTGTLIDGKKFDSSVDRGEPAVFPVTGVIKAWTEVLQLMPVGSKFKVFIPSELGYGEQGAGQDIGPNSVLIFEIELLGIEQ
ncbi:MAG TPA: FKBP-type peptidyl-prolyl cis-trans isomerase [Bacteroidota bacterium]|nr:FKBP-type peptidyl-prolyl cis-trans isomerase [Bacteroidota bacterium]